MCTSHHCSLETMLENMLQYQLFNHPLNHTKIKIEKKGHWLADGVGGKSVILQVKEHASTVLDKEELQAQCERQHIGRM